MAPGTQPHRPWELGPRIFRRGRWYAVDLRYVGLGRPTMRDPHHPHWPSAGERTHMRMVAERWRWVYADMADDRHLERTIGRTTAPTLADSVERYLQHRQRVVEPRTFAGDQTVLRHLGNSFPPSAQLHDLPVQRMVNSLLDRGYKPSTVRQYVTSLKAFWKWLKLPLPSVEIPRPGKGDVRYWTDAEVGELRRVAPTIDSLAALDMTLYLGLRVGELVALRWEDVDIGAWTARVYRQIPQGRSTPKPLKGKRSRTTVILPGWEHRGDGGLIVHRAGSPVGRRVQWRWMNKLLTATGLNQLGAGWHMGRHTYARLALEGGISLEQLRVFLGHASIRTTEESYGHLRPETAAVMARKTLHGD